MTRADIAEGNSDNEMAIAGTMPKRSDNRPISTPPTPKPSIAQVKASEAAPRVA